MALSRLSCAPDRWMALMLVGCLRVAGVTVVAVGSSLSGYARVASLRYVL
jgi:hypothetical protein